MRPKPRRNGYTTLNVGGGEEVDTLEVTVDGETELDQSVNLLSTNYRTVGTGVTMSGTRLHGHEIPTGYVKVAIGRIETDIQLWPNLQTDEASLTSGSITAWPV